MADSTASYELLQTVLDLGTHLQDALNAGDMETLSALIMRRGDLLACLQTMPKPLAPTPQWQEMATTVVSQQRDLMHQLRRVEGQLSATLESMARHKQARQRYRAPKAPESHILHQHVQG